MKSLFAVFDSVVLLIAVFSSTVSAEVLNVWSDSSANYNVLSVEKKGGKIVHVTTQRDGKSGRSFSKREVDCGKYVFRYLGDGDTLEEMNSSTPSPGFGNLVEGSISEIVSNYACRKAGWR